MPVTIKRNGAMYELRHTTKRGVTVLATEPVDLYGNAEKNQAALDRLAEKARKLGYSFVV